ncbi:MAG: iron ABC transporter permease, partial [Ilumatobacteraceae bacterium]
MTDLESRFDTAVELTVEDQPPRHVSAARNAALGGGLLLAIGLLVLVCVLSIAVGAKSIPVRTVFDALFGYDPTDNDHLIIRSLRV